MAILALPFLFFALFLIVCWLSDGDVVSSTLKELLFLLSLIVGSIVLFIRISFGRYFTTIDESYYVSLLGNPHWYWSSIVSGYVTPFSLHLFYNFFRNPVDEVILYSVIVAVVYMITIFYIYRLFGLSPIHSIFSEVVLLTTPLFIWSMIQIRPQQAGLLVGFLLTAIFVNRSSSWKLFLEVFILFILLIFSHLLSFIIYSTLLIGYVTFSVLSGDCSNEYYSKSAILVGVVPLSWMVFLSFPYSHPILKNLTWLFNVTFHTRVSFVSFSLISSLVILLLLLLWYAVLVRFGNRFASLLDSILYMVRGHMLGKSLPSKRVVFLIGLVLVFAGAYLQFRFGSSLYLNIYGKSIWALLLFQMGNIIFAVLYLRGLFNRLNQGRFRDWVILSGIMAGIAGSLLIISFFMPSGNGIWGFHNWFIRGLQFFVPFASPVVAEILLKDITINRSTFMKISVSLLISSLIVVSALNTARIPFIYHYGAVWNFETVGLCSAFHGVYVSREPQNRFSEFVEANLLKACENKMSKVISGSIVVSSDDLNIYKGVHSSSSLYDFVSSIKEFKSKILVIYGGEVFRNAFILSLFPDSRIVSISRDENCPLHRLLGKAPLILMGGPMANPCSKVISNSIPVELGMNYVITPNSRYSIPSPSPWWNATKGLFVVYSMRYNDQPVLLIEGTNLDATLAGLYYFYSHVYVSPLQYKNTRYIVGEWVERDGEVLPFAKGAPADKNGFSLGDKIIILERG